MTEEILTTNDELEGVSLEEIRELLKTKGLDIRELAAEAKALKAEGDLEKTVKKSTKVATTNDPVFELALANYPDFVVRRSTARTEKLLVIMPSQNVYYIKTIKNGVENKEQLTKKLFTQFTQGMKEIDLPDDFWIHNIEGSAWWYDHVMDILNYPSIRKAISGRYYYPGIDAIYQYNAALTEIESLFRAFPEKSEVLTRNYQVVKMFIDEFGYENTKDYMRESEISLVNEEDIFTYNLQYLFRVGCSFKYNSFKEYMLYMSVRFGYGDRLNSFCSEWRDILDMQQQLYRGKIKEKYPDNFSDYHNQLAYKCRLHRQEIDKEAFERRYPEASRFEAKIKEYAFIAPKEPQDFYDEATAQSNCLASYVTTYAKGTDYIFFMRLAKEPEKSLVTIELDLDGTLKQAYRAYNKPVSVEEREVINKWLETVVKPALSNAA